MVPASTPRNIDNIFVPFFTTKRGGSGVGLSISRQLVHANRGFISSRPGGAARQRVHACCCRREPAATAGTAPGARRQALVQRRRFHAHVAMAHRGLAGHLPVYQPVGADIRARRCRRRAAELQRVDDHRRRSSVEVRGAGAAVGDWKRPARIEATRLRSAASRLAPAKGCHVPPRFEKKLAVDDDRFEGSAVAGIGDGVARGLRGGFVRRGQVGFTGGIQRLRRQAGEHQQQE